MKMNHLKALSTLLFISCAFVQAKKDDWASCDHHFGCQTSKPICGVWSTVDQELVKRTEKILSVTAVESKLIEPRERIKSEILRLEVQLAEWKKAIEELALDAQRPIPGELTTPWFSCVHDTQTLSDLIQKFEEGSKRLAECEAKLQELSL